MDFSNLLNSFTGDAASIAQTGTAVINSQIASQAAYPVTTAANSNLFVLLIFIYLIWKFAK